VYRLESGKAGINPKEGTVKASEKICAEYLRASKKFPKFNSRHEGYAVIKEELDELWDAIKENATNDLVEEEAVQVGAMALRFLIDCC